MDDQNQQGFDNNEQNEQQVEQVKPAKKFIRIKPFSFIMLMFLTILLTAGLTIFALTFGEKKVVEVSVPVEREEFAEFYDAYDELKNNYYVEIDNTQTMKENREKIKRYKEIFESILKQHGYAPTLVWVTNTELRRKQLEEACKGLKAKIYTINDIK